MFAMVTVEAIIHENIIDKHSSEFLKATVRIMADAWDYGFR